MTARARTAVAAMLVVAMLTPQGAWAAPKWVEADEHFRHGVQLFKETNYSAALVEFQRAYEIDPQYQVLYNIGESYYQLQDYANALKTFERYLADGGKRIGLKRRFDVEKEIKTLTGRVAKLTITTSEPGATVTVDDIVVGTTPFEPITVSAGRRKVTATIAGRPPMTGMMDLAGGDEQAIDFEIPPLPKPFEPPKAAPPEPPSIIPPIVAWSATGAVLTGALVTGILALGASSDLEEELVRFPGDAEALASAKSASFGFGLATDILLGTSVAAAAVSVYFTVDWAIESDAISSATPAPSARFIVLPGSVSVAGTF